MSDESMSNSQAAAAGSSAASSLTAAGGGLTTSASSRSAPAGAASVEMLKTAPVVCFPVLVDMLVGSGGEVEGPTFFLQVAPQLIEVAVLQILARSWRTDGRCTSTTSTSTTSTSTTSTTTTGESFPTCYAAMLRLLLLRCMVLRKDASVQSHQRCAARRSRGLALTTMTRWIGVSFPTCAVAERTHASWTPKGGLSRQPVGLEPQWAEVVISTKPRWKS